MMNASDYLSFEDPEQGRTWMFDLGFLLSPWTCIYGAGCKGVLQHDASALQHGCCTHGAHFVTEGDIQKVERAMQRLEPRHWQFAAQAQSHGWSETGASSGLAHTRLTDGACIFLNRPGFEGGMGCALHKAALEAGERPMDWKPLVCWQLPLRVTETTDSKGHITTTLRAWKRRDWGSGGADFHWWCTDAAEAPEAFVGKEPVYKALKPELVETIGHRMYEVLAAELEKRKSRPVRVGISVVGGAGGN